MQVWVILYCSLTRGVPIPLHQIPDVPEALRPGAAPDAGRGGGGGSAGLAVLETGQTVRPGDWPSGGHLW